jgi:putative transposase
MKKARYTEEQIVGILHEIAAGGTTMRDVARRHGITETTLYRWRAKYGGLQVDEAKRLKQLEDENRRLKKLVAEQALDIAMLKDVVGRKW